MPIGFRIRSVPARLDLALVARAAALPTANLGDVMSRMQTMRGGFRPYGKRQRVAGPAFPVRLWPGDNLLLHRACDMAAAGDVIVADGGGLLDVGLMGELLAAHAAVRGIAGVVIDGAVRDSAALARLEIGIWARGVTAAGPQKNGPGEIGFPICCGGLVVCPGDLIVADADGVVVVPQADAAAVIAAAEAYHAQELATEAEIAAGRHARAWVIDALRARGCTEEE